MTKPSDLAHQALEKAKREHAAAVAHVDASIDEVLHALNFWATEYGVEDFGHAIRLTEITVNNIQEDGC